MEMLSQGRHSHRNGLLYRYLAVGMSVLLALSVSATAFAQQVSGTVTASGGVPLRGVIVRVQGTDTRVVTDANGKYAVVAPADAVLGFSLLGRRPAQAGVLGRTTVDVTLDPVAFLEEITVTGYTEQRRADITGAVGSVNMESVGRLTGASVLQRLDATVSGVTVQASGSPGSRSTVRVRGISSFQNNDPLYIVDGVAVQDSYINFINPNDITSVHVLKDASSASIYGARASNGVILIETTRRGITGAPQARLSVRTGIAAPVRGYDDFLILDALQYHEVIRQSYTNAGLPVPTNIYGPANAPTVPAYIWPNNCGANPCSTVNEASYAFPTTLIMKGSPGTNWWKEVFGTGPVQDYNLDISGGGDDNQYGVSFNYFNQEGTAAFNRFRRGSVRVNTSFNRGRLNFGENIALSVQRDVGGVPGDNFGEGGILGKNILSQPVVPVYDIKGNFASGKAVGLGNNTNPLKFAFGAKDNEGRNNRVFGNMFAGFEVIRDLNLRTSLGFNVGHSAFAGFNPITPENSEPTTVNSINENTSYFTEWTLSNTARYAKRMDRHNVAVVVGQEANRNSSRFIAGTMSDLLSTNLDARFLQDALGNAASKVVNSTGGRGALLSFFGKADYTWADRYVASVTLRKDGSSRLGPSNRWGTFPAFGLGWRLTNEPFMADRKLFSDIMLRFGWGVTGNQSIPSGRIVSTFGGSRGDTFYDVTGNNTAVVAGFRQTNLGNPDLKWEENTSLNLGADIAMQEGRTNFVVDVFSRETDNLLYNPPTPGTAGVANPPIVNIGAMKNTGFDFSLGHREAAWSVTLNGSHYKNEIVRIAGTLTEFPGPVSTRFGNQVMNRVGHPIGAFYGLVAQGMFRDAADVAAHPTQAGKAPGRIKFKDTNGDGTVTLADRDFIGSPHPDFTGGLDLGFRRGMWDLSATVFGSFGNDIFDVQKEFYVFRNFSTNVRKDLLTDSWTPTNTDAKYPQLNQNDIFSNAISSFYIEDGSYVRLRNLQLGYNVPPKYTRWLSASRIYLQAENLFTITGYPGLDPALPAQAVFGPGGDIRDQYLGVDRGTYPSNRTFSIGLVTSF